MHIYVVLFRYLIALQDLWRLDLFVQSLLLI